MAALKRSLHCSSCLMISFVALWVVCAFLCVWAITINRNDLKKPSARSPSKIFYFAANNRYEALFHVEQNVDRQATKFVTIVCNRAGRSRRCRHRPYHLIWKVSLQDSAELCRIKPWCLKLERLLVGIVHVPTLDIPHRTHNFILLCGFRLKCASASPVSYFDYVTLFPCLINASLIMFAGSWSRSTLRRSQQPLCTLRCRGICIFTRSPVYVYTLSSHMRTMLSTNNGFKAKNGPSLRV